MLACLYISSTLASSTELGKTAIFEEWVFAPLVQTAGIRVRNSERWQLGASQGRIERSVGVYLAPGRYPEHWKSTRLFLGHRRVEDAVTNPPCKKALAFAKRLIVEYRYVVLLGAHKFLRRKPRSAMHSSRPIRRLGYGSLRSPCRCWIDTAGPARRSRAIRHIAGLSGKEECRPRCRKVSIGRNCSRSA